MMMQLGWEKNVDPGNVKQFTFPGVPLAHFCKEMQSKLEGSNDKSCWRPTHAG